MLGGRRDFYNFLRKNKETAEHAENKKERKKGIME
jgi:hypothetical protein